MNHVYFYFVNKLFFVGRYWDFKAGFDKIWHARFVRFVDAQSSRYWGEGLIAHIKHQ